jgi:hypothetical protein
MPKTTRTYWNPLSDEHRGDWQPIEGLEGMAEELTLAIDQASGDYASRPPGEPHGPFRTDEGCLVLEISFPSQTPHDGPKP